MRSDWFAGLLFSIMAGCSGSSSLNLAGVSTSSAGLPIGTCTIANEISYSLNHVQQDITTLNSVLLPTSAEYYATVSVGKQNLDLVVDTGSSNVVLITQGSNFSNCENCQTSTYTNLYTPSVAPLSQTPITINYGTGFVTGLEYPETVGLPCGSRISYAVLGSQSSNIVPNIMGMAYPPLIQNSAPDKDSTFFGALVGAGYVQNIFSLVLCRWNSGSVLTLGGAGMDVSLVQNWTPIVNESYYVVNPLSLQTADGRTVFGSSFTGTSILDTGTTFLIVPTATLQNIITLMISTANQIGAGIDPAFWSSNQPISMSDATVAQFPTLQIIFQSDSDTNATIAVNISPDSYFRATSASGGSRLFAISGSSDNRLLIGQPLMENYRTIFDRANQRIGFYPNTGLCN